MNAEGLDSEDEISELTAQLHTQVKHFIPSERVGAAVDADHTLYFGGIDVEETLKGDYFRLSYNLKNGRNARDGTVRGRSIGECYRNALKEAGDIAFLDPALAGGPEHPGYALSATG